jgi:bacillithiol biosynthesis cysteine-adding enzyme BshC
MGSEDADLDELGNIFLNGEKIAWETNQQGAVGKMNTKGLEKIIHRISGELSVLPFGDELVDLLRKSYLESKDIQTATLKLVNHLFKDYGLVVVIPDNPAFKRAMLPVFEDELFNQVSSSLVEETSAAIGAHFKVQAHPRSINLFYLKDGIRQRIEREGDQFKVVNTDIVFGKDEIKKELADHPERFSPNVILRGLLQETILPNIAFIGGGGELAYWMQLKSVFENYRVPYPVLVVRNSFLIIEDKWKAKIDKLGLTIKEIFRPQLELSLTEEINDVTAYYHKMKMLAQQVDDTLTGHVEALQTRAIKPLQELEKKILRAEKRKFDIHERQLTSIKNTLFPNNSLQERVENFMPFYAKWGKEFIEMVYENSGPLDQVFSVIVTDK